MGLRTVVKLPTVLCRKWCHQWEPSFVGLRTSRFTSFLNWKCFRTAWMSTPKSSGKVSVLNKCRSRGILQPNVPPTSTDRSSPILVRSTPFLSPSFFFYQYTLLAMGTDKPNELERLMSLSVHCTDCVVGKWAAAEVRSYSWLGSTTGLIRHRQSLVRLFKKNQKIKCDLTHK